MGIYSSVIPQLSTNSMLMEMFSLPTFSPVLFDRQTGAKGKNVNFLTEFYALFKFREIRWMEWQKYKSKTYYSTRSPSFA